MRMAINWSICTVEDGYNVVDHISSDINSFMVSEGISSSLASCHTISVDRYFDEGHVPTKSIARLLMEIHSIAGLSALTIPLLTPGMETS